MYNDIHLSMAGSPTGVSLRTTPAMQFGAAKLFLAGGSRRG